MLHEEYRDVGYQTVEEDLYPLELADIGYSSPPIRMEYRSQTATVSLPAMRMKHPQLDIDYAQCKRLKRGKYCPRDIPRVLQERSRNPLSLWLTAGSMAVIRHPTRVRSEDEAKHLLGRWAKLFDEAFFFNSLLDHIAPIQCTGIGRGCYGHYEHTGSGLCINLEERPPAGYPGSHEQYLIGRLMHELTHAFLDVYRCRCSSCQARKHPREGGIGKLGHGPVWANCLKIMELSLQEVVDWPVDAGVWTAVRKSMRQENWSATPKQVERWRRVSPFHPNFSLYSQVEEEDGGYYPVNEYIGDSDSDAGVDEENWGGFGTATNLQRPKPARKAQHRKRRYNNNQVRGSYNSKARRSRGHTSHSPVREVAGYEVPDCCGANGSCSIM